MRAMGMSGCFTQVGIEIAILTGRRSDVVSVRMRELGIEHVYQGVDDNARDSKHYYLQAA